MAFPGNSLQLQRNGNVFTATVIVNAGPPPFQVQDPPGVQLTGNNLPGSPVKMISQGNNTYVWVAQNVGAGPFFAQATLYCSDPMGAQCN